MPSYLSGKRLILLGFIIVLLVAIPLTVYLVQQQQKSKISAVAATIVSFIPSTKVVNVNDNFTLDVNVDPGGINQISFVKLLILYDATKLSTSSSGLVVDPWSTANGNFTPNILEGPTYGTGEISLTISVGSSPQYVIQKPTKIATVGFQAIAPTDAGAPTQIQFGSQTQVLSLGSSDQFNESVLSNAPPANITINSNVAATSTPTPTPTLTLTPTPTPTSGQSVLSCTLSSNVTSVAALGVANLTTACQESVGSFNASTATYTWSATCGTIPAANSSTNAWTAPDSGTCTIAVNVCDAAGICNQPNISLPVTSTSVTSTPTPTPVLTTAATGPICSSLVIDRSAVGTVPYNINFTFNGSSSNSTVSSVTFNFGDGQIQTATDSGGIGSNAVSVLQSHVYTSVGTFTASATLTDANGNVSPVGGCSQTITINPQTTTVAANPSPLPPTGPAQLVTIGSIGAVLTIIGAMLLFAL